MKRVAVCVVVALAIACGEGPPGSLPAASGPSPSKSPTRATSSPTTAIPGPEEVDGVLGRLSALDSYRFEFGMGDRFEEPVRGGYDAATDAMFYGFEDPVHGNWEVMRVGERAYMRGILTTLYAGREADPDDWFEVVNFHDPLLESEPLHLVPVRLAAVAEAGDTADGSWTVAPEDVERLQQEQPSFVGYTPEDLTVTVAAHDGAFEYRIEGGESRGEQIIRIEPAEVVIQAPAAAGVIDVMAAMAEEPTSIHPDEEGVLFHAGRYLGPVDLRLSVEEDGRVVQVTDTSVLATTAHFTTWRLDDEGVDRLVTELEGSGLLDHPEANRQFGDGDGEGFSIGYHGGRVLDVHGPADAPGLTDDERERRDIFFELFHRLTDHSWLSEHLLEEPGPFVPESVTLLLEATTEEPNIEWPFAVPVSEMASEPGAVCLTGDDVRPFWQAMGDVPFREGVVFDGKTRWAVMVQAQTPGYRLSSDPCRDE